MSLPSGSILNSSMFRRELAPTFTEEPFMNTNTTSDSLAVTTVSVSVTASPAFNSTEAPLAETLVARPCTLPTLMTPGVV